MFRTALLILLLYSFLPAQNFEGIIQLNLYDQAEGGQKTPLVFYGKNYPYRLDVQDINMSVIYAREQMIVLNHDAQTWYSEKKSLQPSSETAAMVQEIASKMRKTSEINEIAGLLCHKWFIADGGKLYTAWVTSQLGSLYGMGGMDNQASAFWYSLFGEGNFPVLIHITDEEGRIRPFLEVTEIERMRLLDSIFEVPDEYQRDEMLGGDDF